jgi:hypothetical protein
VRSKTVQTVSFGGMRADAEDSYEDLGIQAEATLVAIVISSSQKARPRR